MIGLYIKIEPGQLAQWKAAAHAEGKNLSEWIRSRCAEAKASKPKKGCEALVGPGIYCAKCNARH